MKQFLILILIYSFSYKAECQTISIASVSPAAGTFTTCTPSTTTSCSGTTYFNNIKISVTSIAGATVNFKIQNCNGTLGTIGGAALLRFSNTCNTSGSSTTFSFPANATEVNASYTFTTAGTYQVYGVTIQNTLHKYANPITIVANATSNCPFNYTINVSQPPNNANYNTNSTIPITWSTTGLLNTDFVSFELWSSDGSIFVKNLFPGTGTLNDGTDSWVVTADVPTGQYKLKAYKTGAQTGQGCFFTWSNVFTINQTTNTPTITITAPSLNQNFNCGNALPISWSSTNISNVTDVKIDLINPNTNAVVQNIVTATPNSGNYSWSAIPTNISTGTYQVKITANNAVFTTKNSASFTITCNVSSSCTVWDVNPTTTELDNEARLAFDYLCSKFVIRKQQYKAEINNNLLREELAKISFRGLFLPSSETNPGPATPADNFPTPYIDLQIGSANYVREAKVMSYLEYQNGIPPFNRKFTHFKPKDLLQRQWAVKEILEAFNVLPAPIGTPAPWNASAFIDVNSNLEFYYYIIKAYQLGIIKPQTNFYPTNNITRKESFLILYRLMKKYDDAEITPRPSPIPSDYFTPNNVSPDNFSRILDIMQASFNSYTKTSFGVNGLVPLSFAHSYNSYLTELPDNYQALEPLGKGWSHNYNCYLQFVQGNDVSENRYVVVWGDGSMLSFKKNGTTYMPETEGVYSTLTQQSVLFYLTTKSQVKYKFSQVAGTSIWALVEVKDRNSNTLNLTWEAPSGVARLKKVFVDANARYLQFTYNVNNQLQSVSCITGAITRTATFTFTSQGDLHTYTDPKNQTSTYIYEGANNPLTEHLLTKITLPKGNTITNTYQQRKLTSTKVNSQFTANVGFTTNYTNTTIATNSILNITRNGQTLSSTYSNNNLGLVTNATTPTANMTIAYNATQKTKPNNITNATTNVNANITYDAMGNVLTANRVGGSQTITETFTYNTFNDVLTHKNGRGNTTVFTYDANGNLTNIRDALNNNTQITVNTANGTVDRVTNPENLFTTFEYDSWGNTKRTSVMNTINSYADYDDASRLALATDANGIKTKYNYDAVDQVLDVISDFGGLNNTLKYQYDANGNLTQITNPKNIATTLTYNNDDQLTQYSFAGLNKLYEYNEDGSLKKFTNQRGDVYDYLYYTNDGQIKDDGYTEYEYDAQKRLYNVKHKTNASAIQYGYDGLNRINTISYIDGSYTDVVGYEYDYNNNVTKIIYPGGFAVGYTYDELDRLTNVYNIQNNNSFVSYTYLKDGRLLKTTNGNGTFTDYTYDNIGRLNGFANKKQNTNVISSYSYQLDNIGNHTSETATEPFAPTMPLLNAATVSYNHTDANRMSTQGTTNFTYDGNGNNTQANGQWNTTVTFDKNDNLLTNTAPTLNCTYDAMENRRKKNNTRYVLEILGGSNVLMERDATTGTPQAYYIHGLGMVCRLEANATNPAYYHYDYRGSVTAISNTAQNITHTYLYGAFGEMLAAQEQGFTNSYRYVGKYGVQYEDSTLYFMRARYYNPIKGRFLGEDPVWNKNLYGYGENNAINGIDPTGLSQYEIDKIWAEMEKKSKQLAKYKGNRDYYDKHGWSDIKNRETYNNAIGTLQMQFDLLERKRLGLIKIETDKYISNVKTTFDEKIVSGEISSQEDVSSFVYNRLLLPFVTTLDNASSKTANYLYGKRDELVSFLGNKWNQLSNFQINTVSNLDYSTYGNFQKNNSLSLQLLIRGTRNKIKKEQ